MNRIRQRGLRSASVPFLMAGTLLVAMGLSSCGGDGDSNPESTSTEKPASSGAGSTGGGPAANLSAQIVTSILSVGQNRFSVGIFDNAAGVPLLNGDVSFRFFKVAGGQGTLRFESNAEFVGFDTFTISEATGDKVSGPAIGVYVAQVNFDEAGDWGVEVNGMADGRQVSQLRLGFRVEPQDRAISIGDQAPASQQPTLDDVANISEIDTMQPPDPFHDMTIAEALEAGRPSLVLFGTPAFCETRTCGPVMETVMLPLYEEYGDQATFIHIEPYRLEELRSGVGICPVPVFNRELARTGQGEGPSECPEIPEEDLPPPEETWGLTTEPVLFVIDSDGRIAGIFEGIVGREEIGAVLEPLL